jgi:SAM-dependent methyltransferase
VPADPVIAQEREFEAILARLNYEVERVDGEELDGPTDPVALRRRAAEELWAVSADRPFLYRPGRLGRLRGLALVPLKVVLRKLMRWYVEPLAADQRRFNAAVLRLADSLAERQGEQGAQLDGRVDGTEHRLDAVEDFLSTARRQLDAGASSNAELRRLAVELDERLTRLERRPPRAARGDTAPTPPRADAAVPDYFAYQSRMRGSVESVRERQRPYVEEFRDAAPVLDVGCGRGEFLSLLREAGIEAQGVDLDADMVAYARGEGLEVEHADALEHLARLEDGSLGGIFAAQLVEHLRPPALVRLLELAATKLRPGGLLVAETINPLSPLALHSYFADLTHAQPLVPETLELLARQAGFDSVEVRFLNEPQQKLTEPEDPTLAENVRRLNDLLFAPLDYAVLARR